MSRCTSGCPTQDHESYSKCLRSKAPGVATESTRIGDYAFRSNWTQECKEYREARAQGIQPKSTQLNDIRSAVATSKRLDTAVSIA